MTVGDTNQSKNGAGLGGVVTSVNGQVGPVTTSGSGVDSVDGQTGVVVLSGTYLALAGGTLTGLLSATKSLAVTAATSGTIGLAVVGAAGQSSKLTSWLTSALAEVASVDAAGVVNGSVLSVGSSAAATGGIRLPSTTQMNWRNVANNADLGGFATNASDQITVGTTLVPVSDSSKALGTTTLRWSSVVAVFATLGGANAASSGALRFPQGSGVTSRNAANSGDVSLLALTASDQAQIGADLVPGSDALRAVGTSALRWASVYVANSISVGANTGLASAGVLRFANNVAVNWRNAANGANLGWTVDGSDLMTTTAGLVAPYLAPASTTGATAAARYFRATATGQPGSGTWVAGDVVPAQDGTWWHCTVGGTPGTWVQSGSATYPTRTGGGGDAVYALASLTGTIGIDLANGNMHYGTLAGNTTFTFTGATNAKECEFVLSITQDSTPRTITWPASVKWAGAVAPTLSSGSGAIDQFVFRSRDGGTTWYGATIGKAFA